MGKVLVIVMATLAVAISPVQGQDEPPMYRLIILNFELDPEVDSLQHLQNNLPQALEPALAESEHLETLERTKYHDVLEEIEYQYSRDLLFDEETILSLRKRVGANVALVGRIQHWAGEIRVDAKIVEIESSRRIVEKYVLGGLQLVGSPSQVAISMERLGKKMRDGIKLRKWPVNVSRILAGLSFTTGLIAAWQGIENHNQFKDATTKDDLDKYRDRTETWEDVLTVSGAVFAVSSASYLVHRHKYNKARERLQLRAGVGTIGPETPSLYVSITF